MFIFVLVWQECYDDVSGFIYYWNTQTNKVTWEKPEHYEAHSDEHQSMLVIIKTKTLNILNILLLLC